MESYYAQRNRELAAMGAAHAAPPLSEPDERRDPPVFYRVKAMDGERTVVVSLTLDRHAECYWIDETIRVPLDDICATRHDPCSWPLGEHGRCLVGNNRLEARIASEVWDRHFGAGGARPDQWSHTDYVEYLGPDAFKGARPLTARGDRGPR